MVRLRAGAFAAAVGASDTVRPASCDEPPLAAVSSSGNIRISSSGAMPLRKALPGALIVHLVAVEFMLYRNNDKRHAF